HQIAGDTYARPIVDIGPLRLRSPRIVGLRQSAGCAPASSGHARYRPANPQGRTAGGVTGAMNDPELVAYLQGALPHLGLRWQCYRKVRARVRKTLNERLRELGLPDIAAYRDRLDTHPQEWAVLDALCRITITRFHRDRGVFDHLRRAVLTELAQRASGRG